MKYIGIRGHRGAGKNSIAYLIGNSIDYLIKTREFNQEEYKEKFDQWVDEIMNSEHAINEVALNYVYFDSFSDSLRTLLALMLGLESTTLYDDYQKDHMVINLRDFSHQTYEEIPEAIQQELITSKEAFDKLNPLAKPIQMTQDYYMTLRNFILYYGVEVMQRFFGVNVWIKMLKANESLFSNFNDKSAYKVYSDVKTPSEVSYIKDRGGFLINVSRPAHIKANKCCLDNLKDDNRYDYEVTVKGSLSDLDNQILSISQDIINKNKNSNND